MTFLQMEFENMRIMNDYLSAILTAGVVLALLLPASGSCGSIHGTVLDSESGKPVENASVYLAGLPLLWAQSDADGEFAISGVPPGIHILIVRIIGYYEASYKAPIESDSTDWGVTCKLVVHYEPLPEIVVTPGRYEVLAQEPFITHSADREEIKSIVGLGEDFYRTLTRYPGVTANDFSARFNIRGGENNEVLALLDGQELYEPFHMKDYGGVLSIIDMEAIGKVNLITGGFPVEYGDKMSGVLDMESFVPYPGEHRTMLGISFTSARFLTEGTFAEGKGNWLVSLRRGYLDVILDLVDYDTPANTIRYYDGFGRVQYTINKNHSFLFDFLQAGDYTEFTGEDNAADLAISKYGNTYLWTTWKYTPSPKAYLVTKITTGRLSQNREGKKHFDIPVQLLEDYTTDDRTLRFIGVKHSITATPGKNHLLRAGMEYQYEETDYDYFLSQGSWLFEVDRFRTRFDTSDVRVLPSGNELAVYASDQWKLWGPFTSDLGIRYDYYGYLHTGRTSPRLNFMTRLRENLVLRTSFGYYFQAPVINALPLHEPFADNPRYARFDPPTKARQYVLGVNAVLPLGIELRAEGYLKILDDVPPRFESLNNNIEIFPETQDDRRVYYPSEGRSRGFELFLNRSINEKWGFWADYIWSKVADRIDGSEIPRSYDQRHQITFDANFRPNWKWNFHFGFMFHSGRPQTPVQFGIKFYGPVTARIEKEYGGLYSARLPHYMRSDIKIIRKWRVSNHTLSGFAEIINVFGRSNVRRWQYWYRYLGGTNVETNRESEKWLPFLPSLGVAFEF